MCDYIPDTGSEPWIEYVPDLKEFEEDPCYYHGVGPNHPWDQYTKTDRVFDTILVASLSLLIVPIPFLLLYKYCSTESEKGKKERLAKIKDQRRELKKDPNNLIFCPKCKKNRLKSSNFYYELRKHYPGYKASFKNREFKLVYKGIR